MSIINLLLFNKGGEPMDLTPTPEEIRKLGKDFNDSFLSTFTVDDLLAKFEEDEIISKFNYQKRLKGIPLKDRLDGIPVEQLKAYLQSKN